MTIKCNQNHDFCNKTSKTFNKWSRNWLIFLHKFLIAVRSLCKCLGQSYHADFSRSTSRKKVSVASLLFFENTNKTFITPKQRLKIQKWTKILQTKIYRKILRIFCLVNKFLSDQIFFVRLLSSGEFLLDKVCFLYQYQYLIVF